MSPHSYFPLNYFGQIFCYKNRESIDIIAILHFYKKIIFMLVRRLISALIWDISGLWNRSYGRDYREKRNVISRFLTPYYVMRHMNFPPICYLTVRITDFWLVFQIKYFEINCIISNFSMNSKWIFSLLKILNTKNELNIYSIIH